MRTSCGTVFPLDEVQRRVVVLCCWRSCSLRAPLDDDRKYCVEGVVLRPEVDLDPGGRGPAWIASRRVISTTFE